MSTSLVKLQVAADGACSSFQYASLFLRITASLCFLIGGCPELSSARAAVIAACHEGFVWLRMAYDEVWTHVR